MFTWETVQEFKLFSLQLLHCSLVYNFFGIAGCGVHTLN